MQASPSKPRTTTSRLAATCALGAALWLPALGALSPSLALSLALAAGSTQAKEPSEEEMVQALKARPAPHDAAELANPDAAFATSYTSKSLAKVRLPDTNGACTVGTEPGSRQKSLAVVSLAVIPMAPPGAPQMGLDLQFGYASYLLTDSDRRQLGKLARALNRAEVGGGRFTVSGNTDSSGDPITNEKLSCARALTVVSYLAQKGVAPERLAAYGFGSSRPLVSGMAGAAENRRVEIRRASD